MLTPLSARMLIQMMNEYNQLLECGGLPVPDPVDEKVRKVDGPLGSTSADGWRKKGEAVWNNFNKVSITAGRLGLLE
jgi:hypothetical protein